MDRATLIAIGSAVGSILAAISMHGKAALDAAAGIPALLQAWASGLPFGAWSFGLALLLALLVWAVAIRSLQSSSARTPHVAVDIIAFAVAEVVCLAQQWVQADDRPGAVLNAIFLGAVAGLMAPFIGRAIRSLVRRKPSA